jgi:tetratricopeptide (TPR) repeat protein
MKIFNSVLSAAVSISVMMVTMPIAQASAEYDKHYAVGKDFLNREQYKLAVEEFTQALKASNSAIALVDRGTAYSELKNYDAAIKDLNQAIKIDSKNPLAHTVRGVVYFRSFRPQQAIADFDRALTLNNDDKYAVVNRAGAYLMLDESRCLQLRTPVTGWTALNGNRTSLAHAACLTVLAFKLSRQTYSSKGSKRIESEEVEPLALAVFRF